MKDGKIKDYKAYDFKPQKYDKNGRLIQGMYTGPDGLPLIKIDGPHSAPAQHYRLVSCRFVPYCAVL